MSECRDHARIPMLLEFANLGSKRERWCPTSSRRHGNARLSLARRAGECSRYIFLDEPDPPTGPRPAERAT